MPESGRGGRLEAVAWAQWLGVGDWGGLLWFLPGAGKWLAHVSGGHGAFGIWKS